MEGVAASRRALPPGGPVPEDYVFQGSGGDGAPADVRLSELFAPGRNSLVIYNFMFPRDPGDRSPGPADGQTALLDLAESPCPSCTALLDQLDGAAEHAGQHLNLVVVAKTALPRLLTFGQERGWRRLRLLSSAANTYNRDYHAETAQGAALTDVRIGSGYDVHAFATGDHVMLGGVRVPHDRGLTGHSDADVALHALVDAVLGALAEGDIGTHFPPSDERWRGASSDKFLAFAVERVRARGGQLAHLDVTLVCEAPRIGPHRDAMRQRIAEIAAVSIDRVAVKATTSEKLGFTGRREGIAAHATATVRLPWKTG